MDYIKRNKLNIFLTFMYTLLYIFVKSEIITLLFFIIIFLLEIIDLLRGRYNKVFFQSILLIPLIGILTFKNIPLFNIYNIIFIIYVFFIKKIVKIKKITLLFFVTFIIADFIRIIILGNSNSFTYIISAPILYMSIFYGIIIYNDIKNYCDLKQYSIAFIVGTLISIFYGFIGRLIAGGIKFAIINNYIFTRNTGAAGDPNYFALYICIMISMLLVFIFHEKKYILLRMVIIVTSIFLGLTSSSRMYYILISILFFIISIVFIKGIFSKNTFKWLIILFIAIIFIYMSRNIILSNIDYLLNRLGDKDVSNGRFGLVESYIAFMKKNIFIELFGVGIPSYNARCNIIGYAHNLYIELFVCNGIIGTLTILLSFIIFVIKKFNIKKLYFMIPIIIMLVSGLALNFIEVDCFYLLFGIILSYIKISSSERFYYEERYNEK